MSLLADSKPPRCKRCNLPTTGACDEPLDPRVVRALEIRRAILHHRRGRALAFQHPTWPKGT